MHHGSVLGVACTASLCRAELEAQMKDKEDAKKRERAERLQEDLKLHKEAAKYNPWGRDKPQDQGLGTQEPSRGLLQVGSCMIWTPVHVPESSCSHGCVSKFV